MDDVTAEEVAAWLVRARHDMVAAQIIASADGPSTVGCFLCQQCLEKLLKTLLVLGGSVPPRTHDLVHLDRLARDLGYDLGVTTDDLRAWTDYAVAARYPGFGDAAADRDFPSMLPVAAAALVRLEALVAA